MATPTTLAHLVRERAQAQPHQLVAIENQRGRWVTTTAAQLGDRVAKLAGALAASGIKPGDRVAVTLSLSLDAVVVDLAVQAIGAISAAVPVVGSPDHGVDLLRALNPTMVIIDDVADAAPIRAGLGPSVRITVRGFVDDEWEALDDLESTGSTAVSDQASEWLVQIPTEPAAVMYSAGRGGTPRPATFTAAALVGTAKAVVEQFELVTDDVIVVAAPVTDPVERAVTVYPAVVAGAVLAFPEDPATLDQAIREVQPTFAHFPIAQLRDTAAELHGQLRRNRGIKRWVSNWWERVAYRRTADGGKPSSLSRRVVGAPALRSIGWSRLRALLVTGSAVPNDVLVTLSAFGAPVRSGYAVTEAGLVAVGDAQHGTALTTLPGVTATETGGEVVLERVDLALGYLAEDGYSPIGPTFATGDLGDVDDGTVAIVGPLASSAQLADGTQVVTAQIERRIMDSPYVALALVSVRQGQLVAELLVDAGSVSQWATQRGLSYTTLASLVALDEVQALIAGELTSAAPEVRHHTLLDRPPLLGQTVTRVGTSIHGPPGAETNEVSAPTNQAPVSTNSGGSDNKENIP